MLRFLKKIFSKKCRVVFYSQVLFFILGIVGYHLFHAADWFSVCKYLIIIGLIMFMLLGLAQYQDKNKEK